MALVMNTSGYPIVGRVPAREVIPGQHIVCSQQISKVLAVVDHPPVKSGEKRRGPVKSYLHAIQIVTENGSRWSGPDYEVLIFGSQEDN